MTVRIRMRAAATLALAFCALLAVSCSGRKREASHTAVSDDAVRRVIALLDYVAADYPAAVANGVVIEEAEYREQTAFLKEAAERVLALPDSNGAREHVYAAIRDVDQRVAARAVPALVTESSRRARELILRSYEVRLAPTRPPSADRASEIYLQTCATCHGAIGGGDGPGAATLNPRPRSFRDPAVTSTLSPLRAFSAITDGVAGTGMLSFATLPEADRWSLAFYVTALRHDRALIDRGREIVASGKLANLDAGALADLRDVDLLEQLTAAHIRESDRAPALAYLRARAPFQGPGALAIVRRALHAAKEAFGRGETTNARHLLTEAYLDGFEPLEGSLVVSAPGLVRRIEDQFLELRDATESGISTAAFEAAIDELLVQLEAVEARLHGGASPWSAFLAALIIVLREGAESLLLVMLLLGLATRAGTPGDRKAVNAGWGAALLAGAITWFASSAVLAVGGTNRELIEGVVSLIAVVALLYAGHFVLARMDAQRRIAALKRRFGTISSGRRTLLLFGMSFVAAYREVFEVVLFLRAVLVGSPGAEVHVAAGSAAGIVACVGVAVAARKLGLRLNLGTILNVAGTLLCILAFVLAGKGIRSLQEAGVVGVTSFGSIRNDLLGVFPTLQTLGLQVAVVALIVIIVVIAPKRMTPSTQRRDGPSE